MSNIQIKPFNIKSDKRLQEINSTIKEPLPHLNQHMLICAPTNSGKSTITARLLLDHLRFKFDRVIFFSKTWDYDIYKKVFHVDKQNIHTTYSDADLMKIVDEQKSLEQDMGRPIYTLLVFDDFQDLFKRDTYLENFLCLCRHYNITVWVLAQYVKAISKKARQQFTCFICFPALSNEEDLDVISETAPIGKKRFKEACKIVDAIIKKDHDKHHFLFINKSLEDKYYLDFQHAIF